ncbi:MAG: efflux transporter outer membrane subunit [Geminicoccaceae bacterium]
MRTRLGRLAMGVALASLTACTMVGPDFEQPSAEVNKAWLEAENAKVAPQEQLQKEWWKVFKDPVLDQLVEQAYADNPDLQTAGANVLQARALLGAAIGELYPQQQQAIGSLLYERTSLKEPGAPVGSGSSKLVSNLVDTFGAQANWEFDVWGRIRRNIQSADANFLSTIASYDNVLVSLTADVAAGYVSLRTLEAQLEILKKNVEVQKQALDLAQIQFKGGTTTELDVYQASTILTSTEAQVPDIQAQIQVARNTLCALVGVTPGSLDKLLDQGKGIPVAPAKVAVGIPGELLRRRPDVRRAELIAASQSALIGVEKGALYPAFSLLGSFTFVSSNYNNSATGANFELSDIFGWKARAIEFGPGVSWNILNYGQITNRVRAQDAAFEASLSSYESVVLAAQREVESALAQYLFQFQVIDQLRKSVDSAQKAFELAFLQYKDGIADFTTVLTVEQQLIQQESALTVAMGKLPSDLVSIYRALGGGWEIREGKGFLPPQTIETMMKRTNWGSLLTPPDLAPQQQRPPAYYASPLQRPEW